jgi:hypothetical protein
LQGDVVPFMSGFFVFLHSGFQVAFASTRRSFP